MLPNVADVLITGAREIFAYPRCTQNNRPAKQLVAPPPPPPRLIIAGAPHEYFSHWRARMRKISTYAPGAYVFDVLFGSFVRQVQGGRMLFRPCRRQSVRERIIYGPSANTRAGGRSQHG